MIQRADYIVPYFNNQLRLDKPPPAYWGKLSAIVSLVKTISRRVFPSAIAAALTALVISFVKRHPVFYWLIGIAIAATAIAASFHFDSSVRDFMAQHQSHAMRNFMRYVSLFGDWPSHTASRASPTGRRLRSPGGDAIPIRVAAVAWDVVSASVLPWARASRSAGILGQDCSRRR